MLEKPSIPEDEIITCLKNKYNLRDALVEFLPLGADQNTAVYRVHAQGDRLYFLKLRKGVFDETSVTLPNHLRDQGIAQIIAPLPTKTGQPWTSLKEFKTILYPYVEGRNGYEVELSDRQWVEFGAAIKRVHTVHVPIAITRRIQMETFSPHWRDNVRSFLSVVNGTTYNDSTAVELAVFFKTKRAAILDLVKRAEHLGQILRRHTPEFVVCHSDLHAGNVLIEASNMFYIIDWDNPILAPKERDLMFPGGGQGFGGHTPEEEEALFYQGYGQTQVNPYALAYYRYERILEDLAIYCKQLLLTPDGGADRQQSLEYLESNFEPGHTIEIAYQSDKASEG